MIMKKTVGRLISLILVCALLIVPCQAASADEAVANEDTSYQPYIAFGQNLKSSEKATVLAGFGITEADLANYKTVEVTNQEEHDYLGDYIASNVIGTRALSSVMVIKTESGTGIHVTTQNINYCTSGMYCNALLTAGLQDADVKVVAPFTISGTSALVGAMKAYSAMTGQDISEDTRDAATDELVTTAEIAESVGDSEKVEQLVAAVKQEIFSDGQTSRDDIVNTIEECSQKLDVNLTQAQKDQLTDLMVKISKQDIDVDALKEQAKDLYQKLKDSGFDFKNVDTDAIAKEAGGIFGRIFKAISDFFKKLFS